MNQGKLEVVKQEMVRVNLDILGISELRRTGMDEFNSVQFSCSVMSNSCDHMESSPPGSSVHGISQARILEWVAVFFSRGSS